MRTAIVDGLFALSINYIRCAFGPSSIASRGLLLGTPPHTETASRNHASEWDATSGSASGGNCVPEYGSSVGCIFRLKPQAETASRNSVSERVVLSARPAIRKVHPVLSAQFGTWFPRVLPTGKCVPVWWAGGHKLSSSYSSISLSHVGRAVCRMPAVCSFLASIPAERTSFMVKRSRGWP